MTRALLILAAICAALAAGQTWRVARLTERAEAAEARASGYAEAIRLRREQDQRLATLRAETETMDQDLAAREGTDAPLSDYLADAAGRLWP